MTLVSCSNLIPLKRADLIIAALALLPESIRVDWHHFGDGTEREALAALAVKTLPPNVRWKCENQPVAPLENLPSEGLPAVGAALLVEVVAMEAGAMNTAPFSAPAA